MLPLADTSFLHRYAPRLARHHYKLLLVSLLALVLGSGFAPASADPLLFTALVLQNMVVGVLVFSARRRWLLLLCLLAAAALEAGVQVWGWAALRSLTGLAYSVFCLVITLQIFRKLLSAGRVTAELLAASMCGFVLLGMVGMFLFIAITFFQADAFAGVPVGPTSVQALNYFSFTTLLTVGFGDIVPLTNVARKATVLLGLAGHFYDVFVVGVVVGKYVSRSVEAAQNEAAPPAAAQDKA
ncbi:two pore domain potassium channel family protein [Hymenobacter sp. RP-2-7]|uniref:Two pore domain potassium channel family protein n=1 Tax=Hymenobacter polaris TaxID=2682546 RepID=A0A7Y0FKY6_9BACT|nr:potassium channel family protein [Hymenobacter polaris]NML64257.1 two pore domain potassium channel family protein [Hymenobacter polaris]